MNDYSTVNILDLIEAVGENALSGILSDFSCPKNMEKTMLVIDFWELKLYTV